MPELPDDLVKNEVADICRQYKIAPEDARRLFLQQMQRRPDLLKKLAAASHENDLTRLSAYKDLIKDVRKHIYYHLRQYQPDKDQIEDLRRQLAEAISERREERIHEVIQRLLHTHISTKERAANYPQFYQTLFDLLPAPRRILDIGCGIHPLSYPFTQPDVQPDVYIALDSQPDVIATLSVFAPFVQPTQLIPLHLDIAEADWTEIIETASGTVKFFENTCHCEESVTKQSPKPGEIASQSLAMTFPLQQNVTSPRTEGESFDLACMLKLIPVIARQQRSLLPKLAAVPAHYILITATTEAMTRNVNIRRREDRFLREFIELTGRPIAATFEAGHEFGYLIGHS